MFICGAFIQKQGGECDTFYGLEAHLKVRYTAKKKGLGVNGKEKLIKSFDMSGSFV